MKFSLTLVASSLVIGFSALTASAQNAEPIDTATYVLPLPAMPAELTQPADRAAFLAEHYWDAMDWQNPLLLNADRFMGESMATYGTLLGIAPEDKAEATVASLVKTIGENQAALDKVAEYAYSYFYHPESPYYNEETYLLFIDPILTAPSTNHENKERLKFRKEEIMKNRVGNVATDFSYIGTDGEKHRLLETAPEAEYRLLMFYEPDCEVCTEAIRIMTSSASFARAQETGEVAVIAINAFGQPQGGSAQPKAGMPANWTVGYSPEGEIDEDEIYVIRTTPAIYLLDREGRILQKDLSLPRLADFVTH